MQKIKKTVSILITLIMVLSLFSAVPFTAGAASLTENDSAVGDGTNTEAQTDANIYTYRVLFGSATITGLKESVTDKFLDIPPEIDGYTVTGIESGAFMNTDIISVNIPDSVTSIGDHAFNNCSSLWYVTIGNNVRSIGRNAFGFTDIQRITIPDSVTSIGEWAFASCHNLSSVTIGSGLTNISSYVFYSCIKINSVIFTRPDKQHDLTIAENAFYTLPIMNVTGTLSYSGYNFYALFDGDTKIAEGVELATLNGKNLTWKRLSSLPPESIYTYTVNNDSVTITGLNNSFTDKELDIPSEIDGYPVTSIGDGAFRDKAITNVNIPDSVTSIGNSALANCRSLKNVIIGNSVNTIGDQAFASTAITNVNIPDSVTSIGNSAFDNCSSLNNVIIGNSVNTIGDQAFASTAITSVTIPAGVTGIGERAFENCGSLTNVKFVRPGNQRTLPIGEDAFSKVPGTLSYSGYKVTTLFVGDTEVEEGAELAALSGKTLTWKEIFNYTVNNGSATITGLNTSVKDLNIPPEIGGYPVRSIGDGAFGETSVKSVTIPGSVTSIGDFAFYSTAITSINIPYSVTSIGSFAFSSTSITSVNIPYTVNSIGKSAFAFCRSLSSVTLTIGLRSIGNGAFAGTPITDITIPYGVMSIGEDTFRLCYSLTSVTIPGSVTSISGDAFELCESLTNVIFERSYEQQDLSINKDAFNEVQGTLSYSGYSKYALFDGDTEIEKGVALAAFSGKTLTWKEIDYKPAYTVTWKDSDGTIIDTNENVAVGTVPTHANPVKTGDAQYSYTFSGWTDGKESYAAGQELPAVSGDVTYTAQYSTTLKKYTVIWKDGDTVFETDENVPYGTKAAFDVPKPRKAADAQYTYSFKCWTDGTKEYSCYGPFPAVTGDTIYTAIFDKQIRKYTVIWKNGDTVLETDMDVPYGTTPTYNGATPTKEADENFVYVFAGWSPEISEVTGDVTYTAVFAISNKYTVIWKNGDTVLETDENVLYGTTPIYDGNTPTKAADENYGYVFSGWSPEISEVTGDVTYTAQFDQAVHVDKVEPYIDSNGAYILGTKEHYELNGKNYAVNQDRSVGEEISNLSISYFEFSELPNGTYQILRYTGPLDSEYTINELVIPDTYNGKAITVLGTGNTWDSVVSASPVIINKLTIGKNITEVKKHAFVQDVLVKVTGDTSNLKTIGELAFGAPYGASGYPLDITLEHQGTISNSGSVFGGYDVTLHLKHATTFASSLNGDTVTYDFTDAHTYGEPVWTWADDYSTATAKFTCADSRCHHEETVNATITSETKDGIIAYTATADFDGSAYTDTKTAFTDGIGARVIGHSISLDGDIAVNFYMELSDSIIAHKDTAYMHFTIPTGSGTTEQDMLVKDARVVESGDKTYYVFKCRVAAKEMTSQIKAQLIDGDLTGTEYTYSVKEYADYLIERADEREDLAKAAPLVKAMLNYGANSQLFFDKNPGALANAGLTDDEKSLGTPEISITDPVVNVPEGVTFEGATLSLKSETTLSLYFKSSDTLTFSCDGYTVEKATSGDYQIARIRGIKAKHIGDILTLIINGNESVSYSPLNYCKNVLEDDTTDENLQNVVMALYAYWQAANQYFD